jgi:hypothetical protein
MNKLKRGGSEEPLFQKVVRALLDIKEEVIFAVEKQMLEKERLNVYFSDASNDTLTVDIPFGMVTLREGDHVAINIWGNEIIAKILEVRPEDRVMNLGLLPGLGVYFFELFNGGHINEGDRLLISGLSLAEGSMAVDAQLGLTYQGGQLQLELGSSGQDRLSRRRKNRDLEILYNDSTIDIDGLIGFIDIDCDGFIDSNEVEEFVDDLNTAVSTTEDGIDVAIVASVIDAAGFNIVQATFGHAVPGFDSTTAVFTGLMAEVATVAREADVAIVDSLFGGIPVAQEAGAVRYNVNIDVAWLDENVEGMGMGFAFDGISEDPMQGSLSDTIQDVWQNFQVQRQILEQISEIQSEEGFSKLIDELKEMKKGGELPRYLVRCCVKMFDPASGDVWPAYEVCGVRKIRKRVNVKGVKGECKCKCKKYYRLECKKGRDNSTRTGVFKGRVHIECQYMDMIDVVRAIVDRV